MNQAQINKLMATDKRDTTDPRKQWWHYRRAKSTRYRDAVWQYGDRRGTTPWETIPTPPMEVLERLEPRGRMTRDGITWQGFHDPEEYKKGY